MQFFNSSDDIKWLKETHIKGFDSSVIPDFKSFVLFGGESNPHEVQLFTSVDPLWSDAAFIVDTLHDAIKGWHNDKGEPIEPFIIGNKGGV